MSRLYLPCAWLVLFLASTRLGAAEIILTGPAGTSMTLNGARFEVYGGGSAGTGTMNSFLRLHATGNGNTSEAGYNSGFPANNFPPGFPDMDQKKGNFTYNITLGDVGKETFAGLDYRTFLLDLNESNGQGRNQIAMTQFKIFLDSDPNLVWSNYPDPSFFDTLIYDLDSNGDNTAVLEDQFSGSGKFDVKISLLDSLFAGQSDSLYLYLFAEFAPIGIYDGPDGGFEEFAALKPSGGGSWPGDESSPAPEIGSDNAEVPEPASLIVWSLIATAGAVVGYRRRRQSLA